MSTDRLLATVLSHYQTVHDGPKTEQILGSTTTLLTTLTNPLNLTLLTSHFLAAPATWRQPDGLRTSFRVVSIFNTAAIGVRRRALERPRGLALRRTLPGAEAGLGRDGPSMGIDTWVRAVVKGADERSRRWQHLLVLTGVLMGFEGDDRVGTLSGSLRRTLEDAIVTASNLALEEETTTGDSLADASIVLALNYAFPLLSDTTRAQINANLLLRIGLDCLVFEVGFDRGTSFGLADVVSGIGAGHSLDLHRQVHWPRNSPTFQQLLVLQQRPLIASLGPFSRLLSSAVALAQDTNAVVEALYTLETSTARLYAAWASSPLSNVEDSPEAETSQLSPEMRQHTWPVLWETLRRLLYAVVAILHAITARILLDPHLRARPLAAQLASKVLLTLRHLFFISTRKGYAAFQVYDFTFLTAIDILAPDAAACEPFLRSIRPINGANQTSGHTLQRTLDLFYLNTVEHLPLSLSPGLNDELILQPAIAHLHPSPSPDGIPAQTRAASPLLIQLYESAHAAILSVLSCPHNASLTVRLAPSYAETLLASFPARISPRQFRLAFKTLMQILSPPFPIYASHPALAETLLEMVRYRISIAGTTPLPNDHAPAGQSHVGGSNATAAGLVSEQSALVLTLIDALPFLSLPIVEEWMTLAAKTLHRIADPTLREAAKRRFWDVLVSGEMDVERAALGVAWWGTKGGRELVLFGNDDADGDGQGPLMMMSGALVEPDESERGRL